MLIGDTPRLSVQKGFKRLLNKVVAEVLKPVHCVDLRLLDLAPRWGGSRSLVVSKDTAIQRRGTSYGAIFNFLGLTKGVENFRASTG